MTRICTVYRSPKKEGLYLYVDKKEDLSRVPKDLLKTFGEPQHALTLLLSPERKLAQADREQVEKDIAEQGWYLQMPPGKESYMLDLFVHKAKSDHL